MKKNLTPEQTQNTASRMMNSIAARIDKDLKRGTGQQLAFTLIVFAPSDNTLTSYISNAPRPKVREALKSLLSYWEKGGPDIKAHERN